MNNLDRREQVRRQLEQRRQVLAEWVETGLSNLPEGTTLPTSLNQVRLWDDSRLEISRIGSPASCTTTHRVHGPLVRAIDTLLRDLARQRPAPRKAKKTREGRTQTPLGGVEALPFGRRQSLRGAQVGARRDEAATSRRGAESRGVAAGKREASEPDSQPRGAACPTFGVRYRHIYRLASS